MTTRVAFPDLEPDHLATATGGVPPPHSGPALAQLDLSATWRRARRTTASSASRSDDCLDPDRGLGAIARGRLAGGGIIAVPVIPCFRPKTRP